MIATTPDKEHIKFHVEIPHNSYYGIGFGKTMKNTDMIIFSASGASSSVSDAYSSGEQKPTIDET